MRSPGHRFRSPYSNGYGIEGRTRMDERVIKAGAGADHAAGEPRVLKGDVYSAGLDARGIVDAARAQAEAIVRDAEERRNAILDAAREEGFRHGLSQWDEALESVRQAQVSLSEKYEPEIVRMAVKIAEKIIGEELRTRPET